MLIKAFTSTNSITEYTSEVVPHVNDILCVENKHYAITSVVYVIKSVPIFVGGENVGESDQNSVVELYVVENG